MNLHEVKLAQEDQIKVEKAREDFSATGGGILKGMAYSPGFFDFLETKFIPKEKDIAKVSDFEMMVFMTQPMIGGGLTMPVLGVVAAVCVVVFVLSLNFAALLILPILLWIPALFISRYQVKRWRKDILAKYGLSEDALK